MRFNPAASFDLGYHAAASSWDMEDLVVAADVHFDQATMDLAAERFEREYSAYIDAKIEAELARVCG